LPRISRLSHLTQDLQGSQIWRLLKNLPYLFPEILNRAGPPDLSFASFDLVIHMHHRLFLRDAFHGAQRNPTHAGHFGLPVARLQ